MTYLKVQDLKADFKLLYSFIFMLGFIMKLYLKIVYTHDITKGKNTLTPSNTIKYHSTDAFEEGDIVKGPQINCIMSRLLNIDP